MVLDGAVTDEQLFSDVVIVQAFTNQLKNLTFSFSECAMIPVFFR